MNDIEDEGIPNMEGEHPYKRQLLDNAITNTLISAPSIVTVQSTPSVIMVAHTDQEVVDLLIQLEKNEQS